LRSCWQNWCTTRLASLPLQTVPESKMNSPDVRLGAHARQSGASA
jgi:hypothetical protein